MISLGIFIFNYNVATILRDILHINDVMIMFGIYFDEYWY